MQVTPYKFSAEYVLARTKDEPYLYFNTDFGCWHYGIGQTWDNYVGHEYKDTVHEVCWLEVLVSTGTTQERAIELWNALFEIWQKEREFLVWKLGTDVCKIISIWKNPI
jgi:hypothetical protein